MHHFPAWQSSSVLLQKTCSGSTQLQVALKELYFLAFLCSSLPLVPPPPHICFMHFRSVLHHFRTSLCLLTCGLPGYSTLDKLMHSNRAALWCWSEKVLLKRFTSKLSQIHLHLERKQIVPISVLKPSYSSSHRYYLQPISVLTRKTFIFTKQNLVIQI